MNTTKYYSCYKKHTEKCKNGHKQRRRIFIAYLCKRNNWWWRQKRRIFLKTKRRMTIVDILLKWLQTFATNFKV